MDILAFDFGGTRGRCGLADISGRHGPVIALERERNDTGALWLEKLLNAGRALAASHPLKAVAISFGGPVTPDGRVLSMHVAGWEDISLKDELEEAFGAPVIIENDANAGALGEHRFGAGRGTHFMAYFTVSTGIGGGVILNNHLYRGAHGMAAEFGQIVLDAGSTAPQYAAGKPGTLEALACGPAIAREGARELQRRGKTVPDSLTARDVFDAVSRNEEWALSVRDAAARQLARGVAAAICAYDVERVVIGGGVSFAGDLLFVPLRAFVKEYLPHFLESRATNVLPAELGDRAPLLGAVASAADWLGSKA